MRNVAPNISYLGAFLGMENSPNEKRSPVLILENHQNEKRSRYISYFSDLGKLVRAERNKK